MTNRENFYASFKNAFYLLAESTRTTVLLFLAALVISLNSEEKILVAFSIFLMVVAGIYTVMKYIDALKMLSNLNQLEKFLCTTFLCVFQIGLVLSAISIAAFQFKSILDLLKLV